MALNGLQKNIALAFTIILSAFLFFATAYSTLPDLAKTLLMLAVLVLCGKMMQRLLGIESFFGILMLRGKRGLGLMDSLAKMNPNFWRGFTDFGLTLGFGLPMGWMWFSKDKKKFAFHAIAMLALAALFLATTASAQSKAGIEQNALLSALFLLGGLVLLGFASLLMQTIAILTVPNAPAGVMLVIPGLTVPWHWIIALIIAAAVHEIAHGILCKVEGLQVKSSGGILFGFLPIGAFVEPDEEKFKKIKIMQKQRILVAGTAINFATFLAFSILTLAAALATPLFVQGIEIESISNTSQAFGILSAGDKVLEINGKQMKSESDFALLATSRQSLENLSIKTGKGQFQVPATEVIIASITNTTALARQCDGLSKINPFNECFFANSITCFAAKINCPPPAPSAPASGVLANGEIILAVDAKKVSTVEEFRAILSAKKPGDQTVLSTDKGQKALSLNEQGKIGVQTAERFAIKFKEIPAQNTQMLYDAFKLLLAILSSTAFLNLALSIINLLPLFITDGSRIIYEELMYRLKEPYEEKGASTLSAKIALIAGMFTVALLLINLVLPSLK